MRQRYTIHFREYRLPTRPDKVFEVYRDRACVDGWFIHDPERPNDTVHPPLTAAETRTINLAMRS